MLFSAVHTLFFYEPTISDPDRWIVTEPGNSDQFSYPNYRDLEASRIFADVVGYRRAGLALRSGGDVERIQGLAVTANFFEGLGVRAQLGRTFTAEEASAEREPRLVVLSYPYWQQRFQGDHAVLGEVVNLNGEGFTVLGVLPKDYRAIVPLGAPDAYVPLSALVLPNIDARHNGNALTVLGRLRSDAAQEQAQAAVTALGQALERLYPEENEGFGRPARTYSLGQLLSYGAGPELYILPAILLALFGLVLLIACGNVAGLLLARAVHRRRELAVRVALGASRRRLIQEVLAESVVLALTGGVAGYLLATWLTPALSAVSIPGAGVVRLTVASNPTLALYGLTFAFVTALLCGVAPALRATRGDVVAELQQGGGVRTTARLRLRSVFVVGQMAAAVVLLVVTFLFVRSLIRSGTLDPGFELDEGLVATITLEPNRYTPDSVVTLAQQVVEQVQGLPGVRAASVASMVPLAGDTSATRFQVEGRTEARGERTYINNVGPRYFETMGIPLLRGREFLASDRIGTPPVAIVSQTFARRVFPGTRAIGRRVHDGSGNFLEIVGVVADSQYASVGEPPSSLLYYAYLQSPSLSTQLRPLVVHVRTEGPSSAALQTVRRAIGTLDANLVVDVATMRQATSFESSIRRLAVVMLGAIGALGLLLAMIGLSSVVAYLVASRTPEIGIRMALGATSRDILRHVVGHGAWLMASGLGLGAAVAWLVVQPLRALLAGLSPSDPVAFAAAALVLMLVGLAATYAPARRAARVDPIEALRYE